MILNLNDPFNSREGDRGGSSSPPSPWASPTKHPGVQKRKPFKPPLLNTLNLSSSASNSNSLLIRKENLVEKVKGSEMAKKEKEIRKRECEIRNTGEGSKSRKAGVTKARRRQAVFYPSKKKWKLLPSGQERQVSRLAGHVQLGRPLGPGIQNNR